LARIPQTIFTPEFYAKVEEAKGTTMMEALTEAGLEDKVDFKTVYVGSLIESMGNVRTLLGWRKAVLQVPSLNNRRAMHFVYWDGEELYDPSNKQVYHWIDQCVPQHVIIFRNGL
jgi:hypothetical protein